MLLRSFPQQWRYHRRKNLKFYSTQLRIRSTNYQRVVSTNMLITHFANNGQLEVARKLFDEMPTRTVVSWNTMISGYTKWGEYDEALRIVSSMHFNDVKLNETTFASVLSASAQLQALCDGKQIHSPVLKSGYENFELVGSSLLYFYAKCFRIEEAKRVFNELRDTNELLWSLMLVGFVKCNLLSDAYDVFVKMPMRDVVAWTTMISGYAKRENGCWKALELFSWMRRSEVTPNEFTLDSVIRACGKVGVLSEGKAVHGILIKYGFELDCSTSGALIEFYCNCGILCDANRVYDEIVKPCLHITNLLIEGFLSMNRIDDAERIFNRLSEADSVSYNVMIKGYAVSGQVEKSKRLFEKMPIRTISSLNTMISVYSRNGEIDKAFTLFEKIKEERNQVTWNSMISGYVQAGWYEEAIKLYMTMHRLSIDHTRSTFSVLFQACSCIGSLQLGRLLHAHLIKTPYAFNVYVGTSLIDMYSKCGSFADAQTSFAGISSPNVAAWTALINGYAHHGLGSEAVLLFEQMLEQEVTPNGATFVGILSACGRAGLVNKGLEIFDSMEKCYRIIPTLEHYTCMVDLLGRSGRLQEAEELIKEMPIEADAVVWGALLSSCWFWMDVEMGERAAKKIFSLNPEPITAYVTLSNMYALLGNWREKTNVRKRLMGLEVKKDPGCSWIELNNRLFVFSVEDRTHLYSNMIYATLDHLGINLRSLIQFDGDSRPVTGANYLK